MEQHNIIELHLSGSSFQRPKQPWYMLLRSKARGRRKGWKTTEMYTNRLGALNALKMLYGNSFWVMVRDFSMPGGKQGKNYTEYRVEYTMGKLSTPLPRRTKAHEKAVY